MKKFLLVLAVSAFAVACNNDAENNDADKDTTTNVTPGGDTVTTITDTDTTNRGDGDTTIKTTIDTDTTKKN